MPVDRTQDRFASERLPDDKPAAWECSCGQLNTGPLEQGCAYCGAGAPGQASELPPTLEELEAARGVPMDPPRGVPPARTDQRGSTPRHSTSLADRILGQPKGQSSLTLDAVRAVIREEIRNATTTLIFTPPERHALCEGLRVIRSFAEREDIGPEFPSIEELDGLYQRLRGE
jgi:hypothetical protein